ncbi:MAG TPA: hypothetical protein VF342_04760 [Alphaproteobacteria bacterium]
MIGSVVVIPVSNSIVSIPDGTRPSAPKGARQWAPVIEIEAVEVEAPRRQRAANATVRWQIAPSRDNPGGYDPRGGSPIWEAGRQRASAGITFAAQRIFQEMLGPGAYFEDFGPAVSMYTAVETNFAGQRRPPQASVVLWA